MKNVGFIALSGFSGFSSFSIKSGFPDFHGFSVKTAKTGFLGKPVLAQVGGFSRPDHGGWLRRGHRRRDEVGCRVRPQVHWVGHVGDADVADDNSEKNKQ